MPGDRAERSQRLPGLVNWFNPMKGIGFAEFGLGSDVFIHQTRILMEGYRTLSAGDRITAEVREVEGKGLAAFNVRRESKEE